LLALAAVAAAQKILDPRTIRHAGNWHAVCVYFVSYVRQVH
jgi:hypothetical protein